MLGERLKALRNEKGKTQQEMSDILDIARGTYAHYEINRREPDNTTLKKIADYFDVTTDYLLGRTNYRTPNITEAAHRTDDPSKELPEEARKSLEDFKKFIYEKHGIKYN
ncbi:MAG: xre [Firmicutes bacterium]|nr:xre [Bacillota bacterium]